MSASSNVTHPGLPKARRWRKLFAPRRAPAAIAFASAAELEDWIAAWLAPRLHLDASQIGRDMPFSDMGLDSMVAVHLSGDLEQVLNREILPTLAWEYPSIAESAAYLFSNAASIERDMDLSVEPVPAAGS